MSTFDIVVVDVLAERQRQETKWGEQNHDDFFWSAILYEELGEAARILLEEGCDGFTGALRPELVQVAAVAVAWLECIDRRAALAAEEKPWNA